jgi:hypothetical protein
MGQLSKFLRMPRMDRTLLIRAIVLIGAVRVGLWLLPFRMIGHFAEWLVKKSTPSQVREAASVQRVIWAVRIASRYFPAATCLTQALVTKMLLRRYGYPAVVRIGVTRGATGRFLAHAWVETNGSIVIGGTVNSLKQYTPLFSLD